MMRRIPRTTWIAVSVTGILTMLLSLLGNVGATALTWLSPPLALVLFVLISFALIAFSLWQAWQKSASEPSEAEARENRRIMLARVQNKWITGFLENKLYYDEEHLPLPLRKRIGSRYDLVLSNPLEPTQTISPGTPLAQVFDQAGGELLILGEAGAGKTTLLLELARDLLERAKDNPMAPMPVVLTLSSWATRKLPMEQWIAEELKAKYDISSQIGEAWVKANQLLLLLDGLDEVPPSAMPACIKAINEYYHQAHRSLVVCSRTKEFLGQPGRLALHMAVMVQPLSAEQVDPYLDGLAAKGEEIEGLKRVLHQSATLRALATTPLFLTVLILAYHGKPVQELLALVKAAPADQPHLLFHNYVERMLNRKGTHLHASAQQTKSWLAWLARQLTAHQQSELYLERLQPDWLPKGRRALYDWSVGLVVGPVVGLVWGLYYGLYYGLPKGLFSGLVISGLFCGGAYVVSKELALAFEFPDKEINLVKVFTRSWKEIIAFQVRMLPEGLFWGLVVGLVVGLVSGLVWGLYYGLVVGLVSGLSILLFLGLFLVKLLSEMQLTEYHTLSPNEGIRSSVKNGLLVLVTWLIFGLVAVQGLGQVGLRVGLRVMPLDGLTFGLFLGLLLGLFFGLGATVQHYTLRFWLWRTHLFPWQAVPFLDDAVEQLLLRKVGGGYIFRHRLLQDYFASLDTPPSEEAPTASASLQKPDEKHQRSGFTQKGIKQGKHDPKVDVPRESGYKTKQPISTQPAEQLTPIVSNTITVMTTMQERRAEWHEVIAQALQDARQRGNNWHTAVDFFTALLAILDGQTPSLAADHPFAPAIAAIQDGIAKGGPPLDAEDEVPAEGEV